jgi:hypothetical protein
MLLTKPAVPGESELLVGFCDGHIEKWSVSDAHVGGKPAQVKQTSKARVLVLQY